MAFLIPTWRFIRRYKWGYKSSNIVYTCSCPSSSSTYNYPCTSKVSPQFDRWTQHVSLLASEPVFKKDIWLLLGRLDLDPNMASSKAGFALARHCGLNPNSFARYATREPRVHVPASRISAVNRNFSTILRNILLETVVVQGFFLH